MFTQLLDKTYIIYMRTKIYDRLSAIKYAKQWAYKRNPEFYNFDSLGGDCTNFVSQCLFAGAKIMNYTPVLGWYYKNLNNRTPSWTGVNYLYNFIVSNTGYGPFGISVTPQKIEAGDVIFLSKNHDRHYHSLFVNKIENGSIYVCSHTVDSFNRNLFSYHFDHADFVHIEGVNIP